MHRHHKIDRKTSDCGCPLEDRCACGYVHVYSNGPGRGVYHRERCHHYTPERDPSKGIASFREANR